MLQFLMKLNGDSWHFNSLPKSILTHIWRLKSVNVGLWARAVLGTVLVKTGKITTLRSCKRKSDSTCTHIKQLPEASDLVGLS